MTEVYDTGRIYGWNGGDCPVHPGTVVQYWLRDHRPSSKPQDANTLSWSHKDKSWDIIAFRVVKEYVEPRVLWVNEEADGIHVAYDSEEKASNCAAYSLVTRIAVKYVECKE